MKDHRTLAEGWEASSLWKTDPNRRKTVYDGKLDYADFGAWQQFASCLATAMKLIEGQAYYPEVKRVAESDGKFTITYPELGAFKDDGSVEGKRVSAESLDSDSKIHMKSY